MVTGDRQVPASLLSAVRRDLRPVRPLAAPLRRALALLPIGLALLVGVPAVWGWRANFSALGLAAAWGLSGAQTLAGLLIVGAALREAVPGRELSARYIAATLGAAAALFVGSTLVTYQLAPVVQPSVWVRGAWECFWMEAVSSLPVFAATVWLASRALPSRPALAGAIHGLGAGLMTEAGVRLFCRVSTPAHVLLSHGGAILLLGVAGALIATLVEKWKARKH